MKITYILNDNNTIRSYAYSFDDTGLDIGDYDIKINCDKVIDGELVKCTEEEYNAYIAECEVKKRRYLYEEEVNNLIRVKYSLSQELSILRQRDTKPEEYAAYNAYCEMCKIEAKAKYHIL